MNSHTETTLDVEFKTSFISNVVTKKPKHPGRNDLCHCNSGKKYKKCCLDKDIEEDREAKRYKPPPRDPNAPKVSASQLMGIASAISGMAGMGGGFYR
jgi:hypothetical protein